MGNHLFWDVGRAWCLWPHFIGYSLTGILIRILFDWDSSGISTDCLIDQEIGDQTGYRSGDLDGEELGVAGLALWDLHRSGD